MLLTKAKSKNQLRKHVVLIFCHDTIGATNGAKFGADFQLATVANSGSSCAQSKGFGEEGMTF